MRTSPVCQTDSVIPKCHWVCLFLLFLRNCTLEMNLISSTNASLKTSKRMGCAYSVPTLEIVFFRVFEDGLTIFHHFMTRFILSKVPKVLMRMGTFHWPFAHSKYSSVLLLHSGMRTFIARKWCTNYLLYYLSLRPQFSARLFFREAGEATSSQVVPWVDPGPSRKRGSLTGKRSREMRRAGRKRGGARGTHCLVFFTNVVWVLLYVRRDKGRLFDDDGTGRAKGGGHTQVCSSWMVWLAMVV